MNFNLATLQSFARHPALQFWFSLLLTLNAHILAGTLFLGCGLIWSIGTAGDFGAGPPRIEAVSSALIGGTLFFCALVNGLLLLGCLQRRSKGWWLGWLMGFVASLFTLFVFGLVLRVAFGKFE